MPLGNLRAHRKVLSRWGMKWYSIPFEARTVTWFSWSHLLRMGSTGVLRLHLFDRKMWRPIQFSTAALVWRPSLISCPGDLNTDYLEQLIRFKRHRLPQFVGSEQVLSGLQLSAGWHHRTNCFSLVPNYLAHWPGNECIQWKVQINDPIKLRHCILAGGS